ncbi:hypothetical protein OKW39_001273 [Paraburkholderia sp. MM6662-R1]
MVKNFSALSSLSLRRCDCIPNKGAGYGMGKRLKAHLATDFPILEKRKVWRECIIDTLAIEHPPVESAFTGYGQLATRCRNRKDSLLRKRLLSSPSGLANSPPTGCIDTHPCHLKFEAFFEHMLRRLLAEIAHNLSATQDNEMISLPVSADVDSSCSSSRLHREISPQMNPSVRRRKRKIVRCEFAVERQGRWQTFFSPHCTLGSALPIWKNQA